MLSEREYWLVHPCFVDDCGECWATLQDEVRAHELTQSSLAWPFTCSHCNHEDCHTGGQYGPFMLCGICYNIVHSSHRRFVAWCHMCQEERLYGKKSG